MAKIPAPIVTTGQNLWTFQDAYVERLMDNSALTSAHPDDTLVLAGPARLANTNLPLVGSPDGGGALLAIGMLQNFSAQQVKPTTPVMSIGSGRSSFVSGKAQTQWNMVRLFLNGRNLLRVLYTQAVQAGIDVSKFDDPAAAGATGNDNQYFVNLDSELFLIPFGLAIMFRDKLHNNIGAFYMELCTINQWGIGFAAGQSFMAENVAGLADRVLPLPSNAISAEIHPSLSEIDSDVLSLSNTPPPGILGDLDSF